jgi:hypothetical protein
MAKGRRWRIEVVTGEWLSVCGPDYEREKDFHVIDTATGRPVLTFTEYGDWPYMCGAEYAGTQNVELAPSGDAVIVTGHDGSVKTVPLPPEAQ